MRIILLTFFVMTQAAITIFTEAKASTNSMLDLHYKDVKFLALPINASLPHGGKLQLMIYPPQDFKLLDAQSDNHGMFLFEWVPPETADPYNWREIFTGISIVGKGIQAQNHVDQIINNIYQNSIIVNIIEKNNQKFQEYQYAEVLIIYKTNRGRNEIAYISSFSGPYDTACFQYTILLDQNMSQKRAIAKIIAAINHQKLVTH